METLHKYVNILMITSHLFFSYNEKTFRRNQNSSFISNDVFKKFVPFNRQYGNI